MQPRAQVGHLDQRVTFQSPVEEPDGQGGVTRTGWANITPTPTMWARVRVADGSEGERDERRVANEYKAEIIVRNRADLTETMSVVWRGRRMNIRSILPYDARREFVQIIAAGGVAQ